MSILNFSGTAPDPDVTTPLDFPGFGKGEDGEVVCVHFRPLTDFAQSAAYASARAGLPQREPDETDDDWLERLREGLAERGFTVSAEALLDPVRRRAAIQTAVETLATDYQFVDLAESWSGVGDAEGEPLAITLESASRFLDARKGYARAVFQNFLMRQRLADGGEGNG